MKVTTKSRYAIRAIYAMIALGGDKEPVSIKKISEFEDISVKYLEQLFTKLRRNKIVKSVRGTLGGYVFGRPLSEITLKDIIYAMDGPIKPVDCVETSECSKSSICSVNWVWFGLKKDIDNYLERITLQQMKNVHCGE
ncbi:MAG: Rrf2 family transcriptional regulator [Calditerrivibrio sp.]|nr:Rrf2 family transcriptional regulator [Calditerrivibrio sp.]MCA1933091.1 Rrf2 family transcriptional regulator [Calditerrivibrio sp.]